MEFQAIMDSTMIMTRNTGLFRIYYVSGSDTIGTAPLISDQDDAAPFPVRGGRDGGLTGRRVSRQSEFQTVTGDSNDYDTKYRFI